jgi:aspartate racemase
MKTIGMVGGTTWHSTIDYYRIINQQMNLMPGGNESAPLVLYSVNYGEIKKLTEEGNWKKIAAILGDAAQKVEQAGAGCLLLGANTMHQVAGEVEARISIPLIHIANATAGAIISKKLSTVGLLGTRYTMLLPFYRERLARHGINSLIPEDAEIDLVNQAIYGELGRGIFTTQTKELFQKIIDRLVARGAEGVILGCTEIPMLIAQADSPVPVFDTTRIHAMAAVEFSLAG